MEERREGVLILGYYGRGNPGDEALLEVAVRMVREAGCEPVVATDDPSSLPEGVVFWVPRLSPLKILEALDDCKALLLGGGGIFQDATSFKSLAYYALLCLLAKIKGKRLILAGQGVGPLRRRTSRWLVRKVARAADLLDLRDERSKELLAEVGADASSATVSADLSFALADEVRALESLPSSGVAVFPRPVGDEEALRRLGEAVGEWASSRGERVVVVPYQRNMDEEAARKVAEAAGGAEVLPPPSNWREAVRLAAGAELALCVRLHSLAFAALAGRAAVALPYDPKVEALARRLNLPCVGDIRSASKEEMRRAIEEGWERREELARRAREAREELKAKAEEAVRKVVEELKR